VLVFDNKYSWIFSKVVHYKVELLEQTISPAVSGSSAVKDSMNNDIKTLPVMQPGPAVDQLIDIDL